MIFFIKRDYYLFANSKSKIKYKNHPKLRIKTIGNKYSRTIHKEYHHFIMYHHIINYYYEKHHKLDQLFYD